MPRTKMLITSTCFQRITLYLVLINFSLCMIIPRSFRFVGQIVRLLCSLQNMLQMTPLALPAHLQAARKIVSDTTVVLRKFWGYPSVRKQLVTWRQHLQPGSEQTPYSNVFVSLTILGAACKCPCNTKGSFVTHFGENIKVGPFDLQTGNLVEWSCTHWS